MPRVFNTTDEVECPICKVMHIRCYDGAKCKNCHLEVCRQRYKNRKKKTEYNQLSSLRMTWYHMILRCTDENKKFFKYYGGRGIYVCDRWMASFNDFLEDMGHKPTRKHQIDRIDNDGPYCKENCRWATPSQNNRNKSNSVVIEYKGQRKSISDWADETGIKSALINCRVFKFGWPVEMALTEPVGSQVKKIKLEYNGQRKTYSEWAKYAGISPVTFRCRIDNYGWSVERAITEPVDTLAKSLTIGGYTLTVLKWSKLTKISYNAIISRCNDGWDDVKILTTPTKKTKVIPSFEQLVSMAKAINGGT